MPLSDTATIERLINIFHDTERQLLDISFDIPFDNDPEVFSPRFYSLLQFTCAQIHSVLKIMNTSLSLQVKDDKFISYYKALNQQKLLEKIGFKPKFWVYPSFPRNLLQNTDWWLQYNGTKHALPEGIKYGNLGNCLHAIAFLYFILNIGYLSFVSGPSSQILDQNNWPQGTNVAWLQLHSNFFVVDNYYKCISS